MFTIAETIIFTQQSKRYWSQLESEEFASYIANNPDVGDVIPNSGGVRKVRWAAKGKGKRSGVRVIYYNMLADGVIWLLVIYGKNVKETIPSHIIKQLKEAIENG